MALEAVVFSQDPFAYCHSLCDLPIDERSSMFGILHDFVETNPSPSPNPNSNSSSPDTCTDVPLEPTAEGGFGRRKRRRRSRIGKNKEEMENQRMTHIAVERNRRKQMNEYLGVLRSLMPPSYSQRGDQASIIGGAINFVKELEHLLQSMESHKRTSDESSSVPTDDDSNSNICPPFAAFFSHPQYSTSVSDTEVSMVESHANIKVRSKTRPCQLLKFVSGLQSLRLSILHLNVTTLQGSVLYSASVKVEEGCPLNSSDEIAAAVHELLSQIEEETGWFR